MVNDALLGGAVGDPRSGAVGGAQRSEPPLRGVDNGAHPAEPRMGRSVLYKGDDRTPIGPRSGGSFILGIHGQDASFIFMK